VVRAWLNRHHLSTRPALGDGLLMPATGSVAGIEAAFRTRINRVRLPGGRTALLNRRAPRVPAELRRWVSAVLGLSTVHLPGSSLASGAVPGPRACRAARTTRHVYPAAWLAHAYKFAASGRHSHHACPFRGQRDQPCYRAARGYGLATGLGTPQAGYLVTDLLRERAGRA
jgi:hypothetical protein